VEEAKNSLALEDTTGVALGGGAHYICSQRVAVEGATA